MFKNWNIINYIIKFIFKWCFKTKISYSLWITFIKYYLTFFHSLYIHFLDFYYFSFCVFLQLRKLILRCFICISHFFSIVFPFIFLVFLYVYLFWYIIFGNEFTLLIPSTSSFLHFRYNTKRKGKSSSHNNCNASLWCNIIAFSV